MDNQDNPNKTKQHFHKSLLKRNKVSLILNVIIRVFQSLFVFGVVMILLCASLGMGIGVGYFAFLVGDTQPPTKEELQKEISDITEVSHMTYADGTTIATIKSDLIRTRINSDQISPLLKSAIISTEDEYFEEHNGVVPKAVVRALISDATGLGGTSGGSTLTQQLVKQQLLTDETTFRRKANEILLAFRIEKYFSKDEIVTTYLNVSPFGRNNKGENIAGVEEAAKGLFGKSANDLTLPQAAFIAGLPQSPIYYSPYTNTGALKEDISAGMKRKDFVLFSMYRAKVITKEEYETAKSYDLKQDFLTQEETNTNTEGFLYYTLLDEAVAIIADKNIEKAGIKKSDLDTLGIEQYQDQARKEIQNRGYTIHSTIDQNIYNAMQDAVANYGYLLDDAYSATSVETGNVLMDNKTGRVIGFVSGRDYNQNQNNHILLPRQIGSSIKPISVYGPAIDQGIIGSESRLANYPTKFKSDGIALENATNSGTNTFDTVRTSLEWSYNIPVYNLNNTLKQEMGDDNYSYNNYLSKMNYPATDEWTYESAPMGSVGVDVLTQTNAFQTLANGGQYNEAYMIDKITDSNDEIIYEHTAAPVQVYSTATASIMNDLMRSVITSKITTPFANSVASINSQLASADWVGKTGTTNDFKDSWLIVSTPTVTLSSWTGYDLSVEMSENSGDRNANYMANLANAIYHAQPELFGIGQKFTLSEDVIKSQVSSFTGEKPGSFNYGGETYKVSGDNTVSLFAKDGAPQSQYKFGIGGTDANYNSYWSKYTGQKNTTSSSESGSSSSSDSGSSSSSNSGSDSSSSSGSSDKKNENKEEKE